MKHYISYSWIGVSFISNLRHPKFYISVPECSSVHSSSKSLPCTHLV